MINQEIQHIKAKTPIKYVHLGGIEILIKACFREGIDTPIEIYLADDRIIHPIEKSVISAVKENLIYQKFKLIISANYSIALTDRNIDKSLVLYWKLSGIELAPGSKIFTARCKNLYILTTKHILKIRQIQGYNYFSKFDCKSGFYHLKLEEESKQLTAFTVPQGFYEWNVLPFGYKNAPGRYQHFMDN